MAGLLLTARNSVQFLSCAMQLVLELFSQNEASIITLGEIVNARVTGVTNLYMTLHAVHEMVSMRTWDYSRLLFCMLRSVLNELKKFFEGKIIILKQCSKLFPRYS